VTELKIRSHCPLIPAIIQLSQPPEGAHYNPSRHDAHRPHSSLIQLGPICYACTPDTIIIDVDTSPASHRPSTRLPRQYPQEHLDIGAREVTAQPSTTSRGRGERELGLNTDSTALGWRFQPGIRSPVSWLCPEAKQARRNPQKHHDIGPREVTALHSTTSRACGMDGKALHHGPPAKGLYIIEGHS
jgi:hypothetical protein